MEFFHGNAFPMLKMCFMEQKKPHWENTEKAATQGIAYTSSCWVKKKKKFVFQEDVKCFKKALTYITVAKGQPIH